MKTQTKLANALKELMEAKPLDTITVKELTEIVGINRQTFYYHYKNIYDLLTDIYLNEVVLGMEEVEEWRPALTAIFEYTKTNFAFVKNTLTSAGRDLFIEFLYSVTYRTHLNILKKRDTNNVMSHDDQKFIAGFYAPSFVYLVVRWVDNSMREDPKEIIELVAAIGSDYLRNAQHRVIDYRVRKGKENA